MALLHNVHGVSSQAVALLIRRSLSQILSCPISGSSFANRSLEKGKGRPFDKYFANHGVFHANQSLVHRRKLITTISDEVWDQLEDPDTQKWLRKWVPPSHNTLGSFVSIKVDGLLARADWEDLKGDALSHRSRWLVQQTSYLAFSQVSWRVVSPQ